MKLGKIFVMVALLFSTVEAAKIQKAFDESSHPEGPKIRVLLAKSAPSILLESKGAYRVVRRDTGYQISSGLVGKRYIVHGIESGLRWGEEFPGVAQFTLYPASPQTMIYVNGFQYQGAVSVYLDKNRQVTVVNEVLIEDYIRSTLAIATDNKLSLEAMSAMCIGARTEAYVQSLAGKGGAFWDVKATDVGYFGYGVVMQKNQVDRSVEHTRFMVLENGNGESLKNIKLSASKLEELAKAGLDAKRILQSSYPSSQLNLTTQPEVR